MNFKKILFPVDFSERTAKAAPHVRAMADRFQADIVALHVVHYPIAYYGTPEGTYLAEIDTNRLMDNARQVLTAFVADAFPGRNVKQLVEEGDPGTMVAHVAEREAVDLVMMPTHGRGLFRTALMGSVTAKVLHDVKCPVWTGVHAMDEPVPTKFGWRNIMCAIGSDQTAHDQTLALILKANELAVENQAKLWLIHAVPMNEGMPSHSMDTEFTLFLQKTAREYIDKLQKEAGTNAGVCVGPGRVEAVVRESCNAHDADLLVIGRGVLGEFGGRLRTHEYAILREAPCPVLSV